MRIGLVVLVSMFAAVASAESDPVRSAVDRALPYLEKEGTWWIEKKKCVSCHHSTFFVWAKELALRSGFEVDETALAKQRKWVWESMLTPVKPDPKKPDAEIKPGTVNGDRNVEGVSQLLVSPPSESLPDATLEKLREIVVRNQGESGDWKPGGQLPRQERPEAETQWVSNQWASLALGEDVPLKLGTTTGPGKEGDVAKTSEWFANNVVLVGDKESVEKLVARQNEDGGWSWIDGDPSGPIATGQALWALGTIGVDKGHREAVTRARAYLTKTQTEEGYWETVSTKDRDESTRVSNFWGTAWAVIGLLESGRIVKR